MQSVKDLGWTLSVELTAPDARKAIDWYVNVFGGKLVFEKVAGDGKRLMHSDVLLSNGAHIMVNDDFPDMCAYANGKSCVFTPEQGKTAPTSVYLQFDDVAAVWGRMEAAGGALVTMPLEKQFWGAVYGRFVDPFGIHWSISDPQRADAAAPNGAA